MMTPDRLCNLVASLVKESEDYRNRLGTHRELANDYYDGDMATSLPSEENRSKVISRDVRAAIKKVKPAIIRTILGNEKVVEYQPVGEGDEEVAEQATNYINLFVFPESGGREAVEDAIDDALRLRNGVLKWYQDERTTVQVSDHTGLDEMAFSMLVSDDAVSVLEHTQREEMVDSPQGPMPVAVHDVRIKRQKRESRARLVSVAPENYLIHPDATCSEDALLQGDNQRLRRQDLVAMGYDPALVDSFTAVGNDDDQESEERSRRREEADSGKNDLAHSMQEVDYYELLVRVDQDGDGIAELRRMVFAGGFKEENLLENDYWDEPNYEALVCERRPHQWEGGSVADDAMEIQKIKTVLLRGTLDNLYWQNNLQPVVQAGALENPEAILQPQFGLPIRVKDGFNVNDAVGTHTVPFVAKESFAMLSYLDEELTDRTGISDASSGLAPDALQNMTAKATGLIEQAGVAQSELMVRTIASGLKRVFRGLLKLVVQHQDIPRTVRLRGEWVTYDPRTWNVDMDVTVNTGLGAGTRERDMMMMQQVIGLQEKLTAILGPDNPFVTPDNVYNAIAKLVEASGLKTVQAYFTKPDEEQIAMLKQQEAQKPTPEQEKAQAQMQIEQMKLDASMQLEDKRMVAQASKEREQRDADLQVKMAEIEKNTQAEADRLTADAAKQDREIAWQREKLATELAFERDKLILQRDTAAIHAAAAEANREPAGMTQ